MDEKTSKLRVININDRYISKTIQFKIDIDNSSILEVNYIIVATNDTFSSPPIKIDLNNEKICAYLLYHLNMMKNYMANMELGCFDSLYIQCDELIPNVGTIIFEDTDEVDDLGRKLIEFSYVSREVNTLNIPLDIMPAFLDTFIQILNDKDIIMEEESDGDKKSDKGDKEEDTTDGNGDNNNNSEG